MEMLSQVKAKIYRCRTGFLPMQIKTKLMEWADGFTEKPKLALSFTEKKEASAVLAKKPPYETRLEYR